MLRSLCCLTHRFKTLTKQSAQFRSALIQTNSISYAFYLCLHPGKKYDGLARIDFRLNTLTDNGEDTHLELDFQGKSVRQLRVNSFLAPNQWHNQGKISLPMHYMQSGVNRISVRYENDYDNDGNGCVSFIDVDKQQYLYTQFQPYMANKVFPLFDQPDLKAKMTLEISCPTNWETVLSNQFQQVLSSNDDLDEYTELIPDNYKRTSFLATTLLPSYLYCFVVGPYKQLLCQGRIPQRLYCIQSLYPYMLQLAPFISQITNKSMEFFEQYFGCKYPFSKYDQVFAHQYKWGAMENAGIVTFNDLYLFKDKVSTQRLLSFGNTIVHELSHHWFGNLVTMKWWDDLWLNESFAQYISHYCLQRIRKELTTIAYQSAMLSFYNRKNWGYAEDELITTHPIRSSVADTRMAESIFDGITYSKGAATMKQLMYLIGEDNFSRALTGYFQQFAFSNAILDDLLASMSPFFDSARVGITLNEWKSMWLETAGTNTLQAQWKPNDHHIIIKQGAVRPEHPTLRVHRIKIGLVAAGGHITSIEALILPQQETKIEWDSSLHPEAVIMNYEDLTFAKVLLDDTSLAYFGKHLQSVDSLSRAMIWRSHFEMVKECQLNSKQYCDFVLNNIAQQQSDPIIEEQLANLYSAVQTYTPKCYRQALNTRIYSFLRNHLNSLKEQTHPNLCVILKDKLIDFCSTEADKAEIQRWYWGEQVIKHEINISLRWKIVLKMFSSKRLSKEEKLKLLENMKEKDSSDTMINRALTCHALIADAESLKEMYCRFFKSGLSLTNLVHQMRGFNHEAHENEIAEIYESQYFCDLGRLLSGEVSEDERWFVEGDYLDTFLAHMDPITERDEVDLQRKIESFERIKVVNNNKMERNIKKKVDLLRKRKRVYSCSH